AAALERARQIVRVNYGLNSLVEAPLLRQLARSEEARGDFDAAWYLEQELLSLAERHPGDLRVVPIFRELAASRLETLDRYRAGESPPQIVLGCYYAKTPPYPGERVAPVYREFNDNCHSGSRRVVIHSLLTEVRTYQA